MQAHPGRARTVEWGIVMNLGPVDYSSANSPAGYRCSTCGRHGCKLWREYQTCADYTELVCCDCAGESQKKDVSGIDSDGRRESFYHLSRRQRRSKARAHTRGRRGARRVAGSFSAGRTDQIGWRIPAVPTEEGDTFWGYASVPQAGYEWWCRLPTRPFTAELVAS